MNTKEKSTASTSQTKEPTINEKKLSAYSLALCKEIKKDTGARLGSRVVSVIRSFRKLFKSSSMFLQYTLSNSLKLFVVRYFGLRFGIRTILDSEVVQRRLKIVLHQKAGISQIARRFRPLFQTAVVEHFVTVVDDEGDDAAVQAFLEKDQPSHTAVPILKGMDALKRDMKIQQVVQRFGGLAVIFLYQPGYGGFDLARSGSGLSAHFIGQFFILADCEPALPAVGCAVLQRPMQLFDEGFAERTVCVLNDKIDAAEVVGGFDHVVDIDRPVLHADRERLEDKARLLVR